MLANGGNVKEWFLQDCVGELWRIVMGGLEFKFRCKEGPVLDRTEAKNIRLLEPKGQNNMSKNMSKKPGDT